MVAGGFDEHYNPRCMVLVTEKVGKCIEEEEDKLFVDDVELDQQDILTLKEHALKGLNQIHACGIVHEDPAIRNLRVEIEGGQISHVWFIDFGMAWKTLYDEKKAQSKASWEGMLQHFIDQSSENI